jgi:hypothetical protein
MLVRDSPVVMNLAQSNCEPEEEPAFIRRAAQHARAAPHDDDGECDVFAGGNGRLFDVERLRRFVIPEEQIHVLS